MLSYSPERRRRKSAPPICFHPIPSVDFLLWVGKTPSPDVAADTPGIGSILGKSDAAAGGCGRASTLRYCLRNAVSDPAATGVCGLVRQPVGIRRSLERRTSAPSLYRLTSPPETGSEVFASFNRGYSHDPAWPSSDASWAGGRDHWLIRHAARRADYLSSRLEEEWLRFGVPVFGAVESAPCVRLLLATVVIATEYAEPAFRPQCCRGGEGYVPAPRKTSATSLWRRTLFLILVFMRAFLRTGHDVLEPCIDRGHRLTGKVILSEAISRHGVRASRGQCAWPGWSEHARPSDIPERKDPSRYRVILPGKRNGSDGKVNFIHMAGLDVLPHGVGTAANLDVLCACRFARPSQAFSMRQRQNGMWSRPASRSAVADNGSIRSWRMIRRILTPPAFPLIVRPFSADRSEHVAAEDEGAEALHCTLANPSSRPVSPPSFPTI